MIFQYNHVVFGKWNSVCTKVFENRFLPFSSFPFIIISFLPLLHNLSVLPVLIRNCSGAFGIVANTKRLHIQPTGHSTNIYWIPTRCQTLSTVINKAPKKMRLKQKVMSKRSEEESHAGATDIGNSPTFVRWCLEIQTSSYLSGFF